MANNMLQRVEKLQVYAILSGEKGETLVAVKDKLVLSLVLAYNDSDAVTIAKDLVKRVGRKPEEYQTPFLVTKADMESLLPGINNYLAEGEVEAPPNEKIESIREVFKLIGTANQRKVADAVIKKYRNHVKFLPRIPKVFYEYGPNETN